MAHGNTKLEKLIYIDFSRLAYKIIFDLNPKKFKWSKEKFSTFEDLNARINSFSVNKFKFSSFEKNPNFIKDKIFLCFY